MKKKKILIVDDEEFFLELVKLNLEHTGKYEVMTLPGAEGILAKAREFRPDVILLDILMPGIDGAEACKMLKEDPVAKKIPVMMLTALDTSKDRTMMSNLGATDYIVKPIEKIDLIEKIEKVLKHR
jgi:DNA-binding response OmpR family regulator